MTWGSVFQAHPLPSHQVLRSVTVDPPTPSPHDALVPTPKGGQSIISCDAVPDSAPIGSEMSCEITPTALTSLTSVQTTENVQVRRER